MPPHEHWDGCYNKERKRVDKDAEKLEPVHSAGRGVKGAAAEDNGMAVPQKLQNRMTVRCSKCPSAHIPKEPGAGRPTEMRTPTFTQRSSQSPTDPVAGRMNKTQYVYRCHVDYSAFRSQEMLSQAPTRTHLEDGWGGSKHAQEDK